MGPDCSEPCYGTQSPMDSGICVCDNACQMETDNCLLTCSGHGTCSESETCVCYDEDTGYNADGFWGDHCEIQKCPGMLESCSGHGQCIQGDCSCDEGWRENKTSCHIPDCPGTPDCNGRGNCITTGVLHLANVTRVIWAYSASLNVCMEMLQQTSLVIVSLAIQVVHVRKTCNGHGSCFEDTCQCDATYW
ncbi:tenascin-like, partial [Ruditapes philippinarum]|uniref:tenascin-like n=1 Tax=Ruditapes philippinarum TaxID=129788 RepID=UPI00295BB8A7